MMPYKKHKTFALAIIFTSTIFFTLIQRNSLISWGYIRNAKPIQLFSPDIQALQSQASTYQLRIAVVEQTTYHDEVIGAVLAVLKDLDANVTLYRNSFGPGFAEIINDLIDTSDAIAVDRFSKDVDAGEYDVAILVTGDKKFWSGRESIVQAWSNAKHLHLIVIFHEMEYLKDDEMGTRFMYSTAAKENRLTLAALGLHSANQMRRNLQGYVAMGDHEWENIEVIDFAPIFPLSSLLKANPDQRLDTAAIVGRMNTFSRNYQKIFEDLLNSLHSDPEAWGYQKVPLGNSQGFRFIPSINPFTLHLIGQDPGLELPTELNDTEGGASPIIIKHSSVDYQDFYNLISDMDLIIPAFIGEKYLKFRSSAAIASAVIAQTPILASPELLASYTYLDGPAYVLKPSDVSEIDSILAMRNGDNPQTLSANEPESSRSEMSWSEYQRDLAYTNAAKWNSLFVSIANSEESRYV